MRALRVVGETALKLLGDRFLHHSGSHVGQGQAEKRLGKQAFTGHLGAQVSQRWEFQKNVRKAIGFLWVRAFDVVPKSIQAATEDELHIFSVLRSVG